MKGSSSGASVPTTNPALGGAVGALIGAVGRLAVAVSFLYYVLNWGGTFFRQEGGVALGDLLAPGSDKWPFFLLSTGIGVAAGWSGGATCRPALGAVIGAGLSGGLCAGLFVLPANVAIGMSGGGVTDYAQDKTAIMVGLLAMVLVGLVAGGVGGAIGMGRPEQPQVVDTPGVEARKR